MRSQGLIRLNLDLTPAVRDQINLLKERTSAASIVEVIKRALSLYDLAIDHEEGKGRLILENPDGTRERLRVLT